MTPTEINRRLALVIGYGEEDVWVFNDGRVLVKRTEGGRILMTRWCEFDYRDPKTIYPIAEKYGLMPTPDQRGGAWHVKSGYFLLAIETCPRACAALAVIEARDRGLLT